MVLPNVLLNKMFQSSQNIRFFVRSNKMRKGSILITHQKAVKQRRNQMIDFGLLLIKPTIIRSKSSTLSNWAE